MISVEEAFARITSNLKTLPSERVKIGECLGRVLAEDAVAALTYPPSDVSSMDGYAVRAEDTANSPVTLSQTGVSQAGAGFQRTVGTGETVRIFTGAPLPGGADAVVIQENATVEGETITVNETVTVGRFVRPQGMDITKGQTLRETGHRLTARDLGLLASANVAEALVFRKPRVGYLATGDELVMPGGIVGEDQIISSNSVAMDAYITAFGGIPVSLGTAKDSPKSLKQALSTGSECDLLVTMGGASVGDFDLVRSALGEDGLDVDFYKVAMRPGKPLIFGHYLGVPMLGLPGNPVSSGVTALLFLRPAIERMQGLPARPIEETIAELTEAIKENDERQDYVRARLKVTSEGKRLVTPFGRQDSAMMSRLADSDCLIVRAAHAKAQSEGDSVKIIELPRNVASF